LDLVSPTELRERRRRASSGSDPPDAGRAEVLKIIPVAQALGKSLRGISEKERGLSDSEFIHDIRYV
jgi:hypothetical protein